MKESTIEQSVCRYAREHGILAWKLTSPGNRGVPDRMFLGGKGHVVFIEFKRPGKAATPLQAKRGRELMERGFAWYCVDNSDVGCDILRKEYGI